MVVPDPGFATKCLTPKHGAGTVPRRRLLDILHSRIELKAQVITAGAGYGKTTLLSDFATELEVPVCWYSLDSSDQDPRLLLEGLLACVRTHFPEFGQLTEDRLKSCKDTLREAAHIVGSFSGEIYSAIPDYLILVVEDYYLIETSESKMVLDLLLARAPDNCHIILTSRAPVELPALAKLHIKQEAADLDASQIAFNAQEIKELFAARYGLEISNNEADLLAVKTEGWIISILLGAFNLPAGGATGKSITISHKNLFRYLTSEVFDRQTPEIQSFLLVSSTLELLEPEFCDSLIGSLHSLQTIRNMEKENLFLQCIDFDNACYRYHQLFRQFLQRKLREENGELYFRLHKEAGAIFEEHGRHQEAVSHFLEARGYNDAIRVIKSASPGFLQSGRWNTVARWIEALPEGQRADDELNLLYAQSLIYLGRSNESAALLTRIIERSSEETDYLLRARALNWRNAARRNSGRTAEARADIEEAVLILEKHNRPAALLGDVYKRMGKTQRELGKFKAAERYFKLGLKHFALVSDLAEMSDTYNSLGIIYKRLCKLDQAALYLEKARQGWSRLQNPGHAAMTLTNISYIYQRRGLYDLARETLKLALVNAQKSNFPWVNAVVYIATGEIMRDIEKYKDALDNYHKGLDLAREIMEPYFVAWAKAGLGETHRLLGNRDKADMLLKEAIVEAREQGLSYEATLFNVQLSILAYEKGDFEFAIQSLTLSARRLAAMSDKDALAKIYFHLALCNFLARHPEEALRWLSLSCVLADKIGYDEFMIIEGRKAIMLMEHAISRNMNAERFTRIVERLRVRRNSSEETDNPDESAQNIHYGIQATALGKASVIVDNRPVQDTDWRSHRAKEIFFYLLCSSTPQTKENIAAAIWPDLSPERATSNFHINIYRIRRAIHSRILTLDQGRYQVNPSINSWFDVSHFEQLVERISKKPIGDSERTKTLEQAVDLYQGPFLSDIYSEWAEEKRKTLEDIYLKALLLLAKLYSQNGQNGKAIATLEKCLVIDAYQDDIYYQLIEQHLAMNDKISASRIYKRFQEMSGSELDGRPSARMQSLRQKIHTANM